MENSKKQLKNEDNTDSYMKSILDEIHLTPEEFEKELGMSVEEFEKEVGLSVEDIVQEVGLFDKYENNSDESNTDKESNSLIKHNNITYLKKRFDNVMNLNPPEEASTSVRDFLKDFEKEVGREDDSDPIEILTIAVAGEIGPAKSIIPVIEQIKKFEKEGKLNWKKTRFIGLYHGGEAKKLFEPYCDIMFSIGQGRRANQSKNKGFKLFKLILKDIFKATRAMMGEEIDILITCGNAGDVRKAIIAAKLLRTPVLHIEQDIYNPIEVISYANLVTVPSVEYELYLKENYNLKNIVNIGGYPMAFYVYDLISNKTLLTKEEIVKEYGFENYILVLLGGDLQDEDLPELISIIESLKYPTLIAPYRFNKKTVEKLTRASYINVLDNNVDIISLANCSNALIYGAGMGMTIEAGVLKVPSIKIYGFHLFHSSINLAKELNIPVVDKISIPDVLKYLNPPTGDIVRDGHMAINNIIYTINNFDYSLKKGNFISLFKIWRARSKFR